jgi:hypothetical protein
VSLGVTGALAVGTGVVGALALSAHSDAESKLGKLGVKATDVEAAHSKTQTLALVADIFGGATVAMLGVTIGLGVASSKSDAEPPKTATLKVGPRGLSIAGTF